MFKTLWREWWPSRRSDTGAVFLIAIFFVLFFYPVFFGGKFFVVNDAFVYSYPLRSIAWAEIRHGRLPLWTPLIMSGYPLLSMAQIGIGYPLTWGYLFLPGRWAEQVYTIAPYLLAPIFIYAYARETNRSRLAALLCGLTFGYGGLMVSAVSNNGLLPNALMWLPLVLIAIERARTRRFIPCLVGATIAYAMSVLTGVGQGFVYAGLLALAYAVFLALAEDALSAEENLRARGWMRWERWRPLAVAGGAMILSAGVAAFQILETMRAQRRSIRSLLSYEIFTGGAYTFKLALKAFLFPLHYINNSTPWVSPLALALAVLAVVVAVRSRSGRDVRVFFWLAVAIVAWVLMLGASTPVYRLLYRIPVINSFRAPARHAFEWTLSLSILCAYGWDEASAILSRVKQRLGRRELALTSIGAGLLILGAVAGLLWHLDFAKTPPLADESNHYPNYSETSYLFWKLALAGITLALVWLGWRIVRPRLRALLLIGAIVIACFVEPSLMAARWWWPGLKTAERFNAISPATRFLLTQTPEEFRVYTRTGLWTEEYLEQPRLDSSNLPLLHGLRNAGGYEPLILERYSRALGGVTMDAASPRPGFNPDMTLFEPRSHVLDILNTAFVVTYTDLSLEPPPPPVEREGIRFRSADLSQGVKPGETIRLAGAARECDTLALVTSLAYSGEEADGATIARLRLLTTDNRVIERELRAGRDTAEWAHDRPDVLRAIRHPLAPVFDSFPGDEAQTFEAHRYWTRIPLDERASVDRIEIVSVSPTAHLALWKITLYDSASGFSLPLPHYDLQRFEPAYEKDGAQIIRNRRALPRAWLVAEAEAVDGEAALGRIRGESEQAFDPTRTALLEVTQAELPRLPGGAISPDSSARVAVSEANRLVIETNAPTASVLIVSEINYPGWEALIDGQAAKIQTTDFLLRGVVLPAGAHRVEMRYNAPGARTGAYVSLVTLLGLGVMSVAARRAGRKR